MDRPRAIQQDWTMTPGLRHQGVLMAAVRGCDTAVKEARSKTLVRYYRSAVLNTHCANPRDAQSFIEVPPNALAFETSVKGFMAEKDALPLHFVLHLMHAAEIVGYYHPDKTDRVVGILRGADRQDNAVLPTSAAALYPTPDGIIREGDQTWTHTSGMLGTRMLWADFYFRMCHKLHINPDTREQLDARLDADEDTFGKEQRDP
jgi:hypothetical protein